jgi:ADP-ribose pyrophosphatase YjhB (NUDIX family)
MFQQRAPSGRRGNIDPVRDRAYGRGMSGWRPAQHIRVVAVGVAHRDGRLLAFEVLDDDGNLKGVRPPGGGVAFGETTRAALQREFREELGTGIAVEGPPAVLENVFTHHGVIGHEIVFAYPVRLEDARLYAADRLTIREDNGDVLEAGWFAIEALAAGRVALFPDGLFDLLPGMGVV